MALRGFVALRSLTYKHIIFFLILLNPNRVWGYYCEWDHCGTDQYCCGDNLCCDYVYSLWYFWVGIMFVILILSACGGLFRYCYYNTSHSITHAYSVVPNITSDDEEELPGRNDIEGQSRYSSGFKSSNLRSYPPPPGPPPPYSATSNVASKSSTKPEQKLNYSIYP